MSGTSAVGSLAFDEYGRPFLILRDQANQRRLTGKDAIKVGVRSRQSVCGAHLVSVLCPTGWMADPEDPLQSRWSCRIKVECLVFSESYFGSALRRQHPQDLARAKGPGQDDGERGQRRHHHQRRSHHPQDDGRRASGEALAFQAGSSCRPPLDVNM